MTSPMMEVSAMQSGDARVRRKRNIYERDSEHLWHLRLCIVTRRSHQVKQITYACWSRNSCSDALQIIRDFFRKIPMQ